MVGGGVPPAHVCGDDGGQGGGGGWIRCGGAQGGGAGFDEFGGAQGMVEGCVALGIAFFTAVMQDGGGDADGVVRVGGVDAGEVEQVAREDADGFGVPDEAACAQGGGGVVFAGCGGGHGPEAVRGGVQYGACEVPDAGVLDEVDLVVQLCFHGLMRWLSVVMLRPAAAKMRATALRSEAACGMW